MLLQDIERNREEVAKLNEKVISKILLKLINNSLRKYKGN